MSATNGSEDRLLTSPHGSELHDARCNWANREGYCPLPLGHDGDHQPEPVNRFPEGDTDD